jgi:hypothetical protein
VAHLTHTQHTTHQVVLRGKALPGKLAARGEWPVVQLLMNSPPPPTTWLGVQALRRNEVPGLLLPLSGIEGSTVELIAAAADADGRAAMYGEFARAAALGVESLGCKTRGAKRATNRLLPVTLRSQVCRSSGARQQRLPACPLPPPQGSPPLGEAQRHAAA